jgi:Flp pilus assembly protein TadB
MALLEFCRHFPAFPLRSMNHKVLAFLGIEPERYMGMLVALSLLAGIIALIALKSVVGALAGFALVASILLALPQIEKRRRAGELESELPLFLRSLGMLIEFGVPFQRALEVASKGCGILEDEVGRCIAQVRQGISIPRALSSMARSYDSMALRRAFSSLIISFESGGGGSEIRKIGDDMLALEQFRLKEYASKGAIFGLVLIVVSAILPTFFLVYSVAGISEQVGEGTFRLVMLVVFPLMSLIVIIISKSMMPKVVFGNSGFDFFTAAPGAIVIAGYVFFPKFQALFFAAGVIAGAYVLQRTYISERRLEEIERNLPDALFSAGGMPKSSSAERLFRMIGEGGFGALSEEAAKSLSQIRANVSGNSVLDDLWRRNRSKMLRRACLILRNMMDTNSLDRVSMLADDMIRSLHLKRERAAVFSMQKYTLLAGALIIPLILKMTLGLLASMGSLLEGGAEIGPAEAVIPAYLLIYSLVSAAAIGDYEGKKSSSVVYLALMAILSLGAFHFIKF